MTHSNQVLWALDNSIQPLDFERLCIDLLGRYGHRHITPIGGTQDHGRDAEFKYWNGAADGYAVTVFQFSLQEAWETKLRKDAVTVAKYCAEAKALVFATSRKVTGAKQDQLKDEFKLSYGWDLFIYSREWFRHKLVEFDQDLAQKYLGLELPPTIGHVITQIELSLEDDDHCKDLFKNSSPELVKASILESTRKEPNISKNWHLLARVEFILRSYPGALEAVNKALQTLDPTDKLAELNMTNFKGAILAEMGIQNRSRPLLIQAKDIFQHAADKIKRSVDFYNLANVLDAIDESEEAERNYRLCLDIKSDYAQAWKNLGSLLAKNGQRDEAMECFAKALRYLPNLVEAHLSMANAYLLLFDCPEKAVQSFATAYALDPDLDRKWNYTHYWYSKALILVERFDDALIEIEKELLMRPDDNYLLNQKATTLTKLRKQNPIHDQKALDFFQFRARALPKDYPGLNELIQIYKERGSADEAWPWVDDNLKCSPLLLSQVAKRAQIPISEFQVGFLNSKLYSQFRKRWSADGHYETFRKGGLSPNREIITVLNYALMAPFGMLGNALYAQRESPNTAAIETALQIALDTQARLFPAFGALWLTSEPPTDKDRLMHLISSGINHLKDVIVLEACRQVRFLTLSFGINYDFVPEGEKINWDEIDSKMRDIFLSQISKDWVIFG